MTFDYEGWLKAAQGRLESLYQQKATIESEISKLEHAIKGFAPLVKNPAKWFGANAGVTDAIREIFKSEPTRAFTATGIRDALLDRGVAMKQKNPMATVHQILARLVASGNVKLHTLEPGSNHYQWIKPKETEGLAEGQRDTPKRSRRSRF